MVENLLVNSGDMGSIPGLGTSLGEGNGNRLQYSGLENPMDREVWWATVHWVTKSRTRQSVKFRTISAAVLQGPSTLWVRGKLLPLATLRASTREKRKSFFSSLLILSSALAWSYCTYANEAMSAIEANSAIYSWSLATLITAAADLRKPKHTRVRAHTHTCTHTYARTHTRTHTTQSIFFSPGYKFPIPLQSGPSHATLIVCYITFIKK